jgi:acyl transferase domain-containing protein/acyl carrier protein
MRGGNLMDNDVQTPEDDALEAIAVIGMAGRFPGGNNLDQYWRNLLEGIECITQFTDDQLSRRGIPNEWLTNTNYVKAGTVLEDFDKFDAAFFGYSPVEAESIDPQQRIFLETAWEALEYAGYNPENYDGAIGVFAGSNPNHYQDLLPHHNDCRDVAAEMERLIGNEKDFLCTRVSYKLNLRGPSITVQTGCSTSLVAVHTACQNLLNYQCSMALAGGVSINLKQCSGYFFQDGTIVCPDGHCRAFDAKAQGTVLGQGVGIVVLKRLSEAMADGDSIYAVIKATAINNDGTLKAGFTAPSVDGQAEVIAMAQALAGVSADTISYIEAHGTGTALGDPIEIAALTQAFRASTSKNGFCGIGSVKTNIGHADAAAGIAGLIKTILMLRHKKIPPSLHFDQPNPNIDFENSPFYVPTRSSDWRVKGFPRRAGVSSFGIGGTNAHAILEEGPEIGKSGESRPWQLLLLSGHTASGLEELTTKIGDHLNTYPHLNPADLAYTLNTGRKTLNYRRALVCRDAEEAAARLAVNDKRNHWDAYQEPTQRDVVFLFSGQGSQYVNMGLELYQGEVVFREAVDRCCDTLQAHLGSDLREVMYPSAGGSADAQQRLQQTSIAQPALFTIEYALTQLWMSWGVEPESMVGHSIGEYVAGCLAQVFSLDDVLSLVAARGRLMQQLPAGSMLAVSLSEAEVEDVLGDDLCLAAVNAPGFCVVSGESGVIEGLEKRLGKQGVSYTRLHTSHAFHSKMMDPILAEFEEAVRKVQLNAPQIPIMSNTTGSWMQAAEATDPGYWVRHLRQAVRFSDSIQELLGDASRILLEVGPGNTLCTLAKQHIEDPKERVVLSSIRHPKEERSDVEFSLTTLGKLWLAGVEVNWQGFYQDERRQRIPLPTYPFQRQRFWPQSPVSVLETSNEQKLPAKRTDQKDWFCIPSWKRGQPLDTSKDIPLAEKLFSWLIFLDQCGVGNELALRLKSCGHQVATVNPGDRFQLNMPSDYTINPKESEDYVQLLQELKHNDRIPDNVVHLWCLNQETEKRSEEEWLDLSLDLGFNSLLFLAQAIGNQLFSNSLTLKVISNHLYDVTGNDALIPQKSLLLGPCKVIHHEYPNVQCSNIDLVLPQEVISGAKPLLNLLLTEITTETEEPIVALRGQHRWIQFFEPLNFEKISNSRSKIKPGGVYFITGGLGGLGLTLAEHLVQSKNAKLVLVARTELPPRDEWPRWLEIRDSKDPTSDKIRKLVAIEQLGGDIMTVAADVTDAEQMRVAIQSAIDRFERIDGVIHAAGVASGGIMQLKTAEVVTETLAPKIKGFQNLVNCFNGLELDFIVLCSALSALFGEAGQVDYCAANSVLDAYAHKCHEESNVVSIDWGTWRDVGMAVNSDLPPDLRAARESNLNLGIAPEEGKKAFGQALSLFMPQVVVSPPELFRRFETGTLVAESEDTRPVTEASADETWHPRPDLSSVYVVPGNSTEEAIANIWQELLKIGKVGIHDNFFDIGGHSLLATRLIARLRDAFPIEFTMADLFERPTIHSLSEMVLELENGLPTFTESRDRGQRRKEKRLQRMNPKRNRVARGEFKSI